MLFLVLDKNFQVKLMLIFLFSQSHRSIKMRKILANLDGSLNIEKIALKTAL